LLRCINLLDEPDRGAIRVGARAMRFGVDRGAPGRTRARRLSRPDRHGLQHFNLFPLHDGARQRMAGPTIDVGGIPGSTGNIREYRLGSVTDSPKTTHDVNDLRANSRDAAGLSGENFSIAKAKEPARLFRLGRT